MRTRSEELAARHRRVVWLSLGAAALVHVAVFAFSPTFRAEPVFGPDEPAVAGPLPDGDATPAFVRLLFGPPEIIGPDGRPVREERRLEADHVIALPDACRGLGRPERLPLHALVRLRVGERGGADVRAIVRGTGDACGDSVVTAVADALRYRWLPDARFPAPVDLVQPVTLLAPPP